MDLLQTAVEYTRRGWHVFPLHTPTGAGCSCGKCDPDSSGIGKHPRTRDGFKSASKDEACLLRWWNKWPQANIGVLTGSTSGLVVLDVDDKDNGAGSASLATLEREHGGLPDTLSCSTGTGRHLYFQHPGEAVQSSTGKIGDGLDVRGDGGYVVAPPSLHKNGKTYQWLNPGSASAALPVWLQDLMRGSREALPALVPIGSRNGTLASYAGRLRAQGMEQKEIGAALLDRNSTDCAVPLPAEEVLGIATSVAKYPPGQVKLPWFQFYPSEWFANNAVRLGCDFQRGWLIQLLAECWRQGGVLPDDPEMLWRFAGAPSKAAFEHDGDNLLVLSEFELRQLEDGSHVLLHPWMATHYQVQAEKYLQRCAAGAASAASRKRAQTEAA
jgi:hypothetical protein